MTYGHIIISWQHNNIVTFCWIIHCTYLCQLHHDDYNSTVDGKRNQNGTVGRKINETIAGRRDGENYKTRKFWGAIDRSYRYLLGVTEHVKYNCSGSWLAWPQHHSYYSYQIEKKSKKPEMCTSRSLHSDRLTDSCFTLYRV